MSKASDNLSKRQRAFVELFAENWSQTDAYATVFKSKKRSTAATESGKLLKHPECQAYLWELVEEKKKQVMVDSIFVLNKFLTILRSDYVEAAQIEVDEEDIFGMPKELRVLVQGIDIIEKTYYKGQAIDYKQRTYKFKFMNKDKALESLGKHLGMFIERLDISGTIGVMTFASVVAELHDFLEDEDGVDFLQ